MEFLSRYLDTLRKRPVAEYPASQVVEVKPDDYIHHTPFHREDSLIVYGLPTHNTVSFVNNPVTSVTYNPSIDSDGNTTTAIATVTSSSVQALSTPNFEVVFYRDAPKVGSQTAFSLLRTTDLDTAKRQFDKFSEILPTFSTSCPSLVTVDTLQEICNYVRDHPYQSLAHIAANFSWNDCFKHQTVQYEVVEMVDPDTNLTPLLVALKNGRKETIQAILNLNPRLDVTDKDDNNVLHFAAPTSKEIISIVCNAINALSNQTLGVNSPPLAPNSPVTGVRTAGNSTFFDQTSSDPPSREETLLYRLINSRNKSNVSPLHLACISDKPDCVKELLKNGAHVNGACMASRDSSRDRTPTRRRKLPQIPGNQNGLSPNPISSPSESSPLESNNNSGFDKIMIDHLNPKDMKNGGNPLHWAKSPQCMEPLIEMGCDINAKNFQGETVLHVMVSRRQLSCVVTLLSYGADVNEKGPNGVTPLHIAAR